MTHYGLDSPGIKSWWRQDFPHLGPPSLLYNGYQVSLSGIKQLKCGTDNPTPSGAEIKEREELYLYSLFGPV